MTDPSCAMPSLAVTIASRSAPHWSYRFRDLRHIRETARGVNVFRMRLLTNVAAAGRR